MKRWLAAAGGAAIATLIVVACAEHAPQTPTQVAQSGGSGDENGLVRAQETPQPPVFPSTGPTPQTFPSTGPTPQTFPSTGPTPRTFPSTGPTPQTFPSTGPTPQTFPSTGPTPQTFPTTANPQPTPTPTPTATPTTGPTPTPSPFVRLTVTNLRVGSGRNYVLAPFEDGSCCDASNGPVWIDLNYHYQTNRSATNDRVYIIRTAHADRQATQDPMVTFQVNKCAQVFVYLPEVDPAPCYPDWITADGWSCSLAVNPNGTCDGGGVTTLINSNPPNDQLVTAVCSKLFPANSTVRLGPRRPSGPPEYMYGLVVAPSFFPTDCDRPFGPRPDQSVQGTTQKGPQRHR